MTVAEAIHVIMEGVDKRARKIIFPTKPWLANYIRPIFPDYVDRKLYKMAKL